MIKENTIETTKYDIKYIPKLNENNQIMDIVPGFPVNKRIKYDESKMIQAIQNGMILLILYRGEEDTWKNGRERVISPLVIGKNKNTGNILIRGWHLSGYSVSQKKETKKVWRLFKADNILGMTFTGHFYRLPPKGYKMNDRVMTEKTICRADFNTIRTNQDALIKAGKIESEEKVTIGTKESSITVKIQIQNTNTTLDLNKFWDNEKTKPLKNTPKEAKITICKTVFSNDYLAIFNALGEKGKTVKIYEGKKLLGSYKTIASFTGDQINSNKNMNGMNVFDLYQFEKKL